MKLLTHAQPRKSVVLSAMLASSWLLEKGINSDHVVVGWAQEVGVSGLLCSFAYRHLLLGA